MNPSFNLPELKCKYIFSYIDSEKQVSITQVFPDGARWTELVPLFKDYLTGIGFVFPPNTEFVLMPVGDDSIGTDEDY